MLKKSNHRKETDIDFEEKKLNLGLGEEELDKENDYYTRPASPVLHGDVPPPYVPVYFLKICIRIVFEWSF